MPSFVAGARELVERRGSGGTFEVKAERLCHELEAKSKPMTHDEPMKEIGGDALFADIKNSLAELEERIHGLYTPPPEQKLDSLEGKENEIRAALAELEKPVTTPIEKIKSGGHLRDLLDEAKDESAYMRDMLDKTKEENECAAERDVVSLDPVLRHELKVFRGWKKSTRTSWVGLGSGCAWYFLRKHAPYHLGDLVVGDGADDVGYLL
ncbi:hypothetical protein K469DRAFT_696072 [Zopfia rhizophila CBS 207.26]|uniref:Uncharacterized protein n=1 Tax=Zopfia rhizophila CBS 207.26 TaxID=1314779 RepID=A0A6A6EML0_9PEZI|nr:hypothetical protein K469DRAFT_696072 [Zopfia rhizophila CBS 207.26]